MCARVCARVCVPFSLPIFHGHTNPFCVSALVNSAVVNTEVELSLGTLFSFTSLRRCPGRVAATFPLQSGVWEAP